MVLMTCLHCGEETSSKCYWVCPGCNTLNLQEEDGTFQRSFRYAGGKKLPNPHCLFCNGTGEYKAKPGTCCPCVS